ncbi:hypothetical protein H4I95_02361 [Botrytis cinerea]
MQQVITQTLVDDRFIQISDSKKSEGLATDSTKRQSQEQPIHDKDPIKAATAAMAATPLSKSIRTPGTTLLTLRTICNLSTFRPN